MAPVTIATPPAMDATPVSSSRSRGSTIDEPKLRNSCETCAASKLKCSQDKPTCTRCAKRGLSCKYVIAKRGGRKPKRYPSANENNASKRIDDGNSPAASQWSAAGPLDRSYPYCSTSMNGSAPPAITSDAYNPLDQTPLEVSNSNMEMPINFDFDDGFLLGFPGSDGFSDFCNVGPADGFPPGIEPGLDNSGSATESLCDGFSLADDMVLGFFAPSGTVPEPQQQVFSPPASENPQSYEEMCLDGSCSCLIEALSLMKQLVTPPPPPSLSSRNGSASQPNIQTIIDRNEVTIESVRSMLKCSCSQDDGYLLSVMSLIIFKVLGWYASVVRQTALLQDGDICRSRQPSAAPSVSSYSLDGADSARMAAQLVLGEIHYVRRIVRQLSVKLKVQVEKERSRPDTNMMEGLEMMDDEMSLPLSATMYGQLDADLKRRLHALSLEMIDRLRRC